MPSPATPPAICQLGWEPGSPKSPSMWAATGKANAATIRRLIRRQLAFSPILNLFVH
ncbi:unnamed protein product [Penicillium salamii]|nr:unnamed protein product [Penicillium salamii]